MKLHRGRPRSRRTRLPVEEMQHAAQTGLFRGLRLFVEDEHDDEDDSQAQI